MIRGKSFKESRNWFPKSICFHWKSSSFITRLLKFHGRLGVKSINCFSSRLKGITSIDTFRTPVRNRSSEVLEWLWGWSRKEVMKNSEPCSTFHCRHHGVSFCDARCLFGHTSMLPVSTPHVPNRTNGFGSSFTGKDILTWERTVDKIHSERRRGRDIKSLSFAWSLTLSLFLS